MAENKDQRLKEYQAAIAQKEKQLADLSELVKTAQRVRNVLAVELVQLKNEQAALEYEYSYEEAQAAWKEKQNEPI